MRNRKFRFGFTVIELLVVVSLMGTFASIVIAGLQGARAKGQIAAGQQFDGYNYRAFSADAYGVWNFDESAGGTTADISGNNMTGTLMNGTAWLSPGFRGNSALSFDGIDDYVNIPDLGSQTNSFSSITVSLWVKINQNFGTAGALVTRGPALGTPQWSLTFSSNKLIWRTNSGASGFSCGVPSKDVWHHIAATQKGSNATLYIDGKVCSTTDSAPASVDGIDTVNIGNYLGGSLKFIGILDEVRIYKSALIASEIYNLYTQGATGHDIALVQ